MSVGDKELVQPISTSQQQAFIDSIKTLADQAYFASPIGKAEARATINQLVDSKRYVEADYVLNVYFDQSLQGANQQDSAFYHFNKAIVWRIRAELDTTIVFAKKVLEIADVPNDWRMRCYNLLGMKALYSSDFSLGIKYFKAAIALIPDPDTSFFGGLLHNNLFATYSNLGLDSLALVNLKQAIRYHKTDPDSSNLGFALRNLWAHYHHRDLFFEADSVIDIAIRVGESTDSPVLLRGCYCNKAATMAKLGYAKQTRKYLDACLNFDIEDVNGQRRNIPALALGALTAYNFLGMPDSAIYYGNLGMTNKGLLVGKRNYIFLHEGLKDAYILKGDFKRALAHSDSIVRLQREFYVPEILKQRSQLQSEFQEQQKDLELAYLQQQALIKDDRIADQAKWLTVLGLLFALVAVALIALARLGQINRTKTAEIKRINLLLQGQNQELKELSGTKDRIFQIIAHDLRGPIHGFMALPEILETAAENNDTDFLKELGKQLGVSVKGLSRLIDSLLLWAQSQNGTLAYNPEPMPVLTLLQLIDDLYNKTAAIKHVKLVVEPCSHDYFIMADPPSVETALRNLVNNAIKFTPRGGVVRIYATGEEKVIRLCVADNGIGISVERQRHLLNLKSRQRRLGTEGEKGSGLGLILVQDLAKHNHGTLEMQSVEGQGSTFSLQLPRVEVKL